MRSTFKSGLTLIELLVSVGISALILGFLIAGYNDFKSKRQLDLAAEELKTWLRLVRTKAMAGEKPPDSCDTLEGYKVEWFSDKIIRYFPICDGADQDDFLVRISLKTEEVSILPFAEFSFEVLTGKASKETDIQLEFNGVTRSLTVLTSGEIE